MFRIISFIWQLPQNIIGAILLFVFSFFGKCKACVSDDIKYHSVSLMCNGDGISLGQFIFLGDGGNRHTNWQFTLHHEFGHSIQSKILGWFYLLVIGLPSLCWAIVAQFSFSVICNYYWFYTESWANKLGHTDLYKK